MSLLTAIRPILPMALCLAVAVSAGLMIVVGVIDLVIKFIDHKKKVLTK